MKTLAFVLGVAVLAVALPSGAPSAQEVHTFKCPPLTTLKFNWQNKIDTQPTDFPIAPGFDGSTWHPQFKESAVDIGANTVQCAYILAPMPALGPVPYRYKVHRKIISCTGQPGPTIECKLKKD